MNLSKLLHIITETEMFDFVETSDSFLITHKECWLSAEISKSNGAIEYFAGTATSTGCQYFEEQTFNELRDLVAFLKSEVEKWDTD